MVWWGCRHASKISWGCRHVDKACATYLRYDVIHDIQICCSLGSISARRTSPPVPGAVPCIMEQARYHANRAQRLEQAARRARAWAAELRRAELAGEQAQTPELAAKKAARRTLQRAKAKAKAAAAAAAAEQQEQQEPQQQPQQQQRQQQQEQQQQPQHHPQHVGERSSSSRSQVVGEPTSTGARVVGTPTRTGGGVVGKPTSTGTPGLMAPFIGVRDSGRLQQQQQQQQLQQEPPQQAQEPQQVQEPQQLHHLHQPSAASATAAPQRPGLARACLHLQPRPELLLGVRGAPEPPADRRPRVPGPAHVARRQAPRGPAADRGQDVPVLAAVRQGAQAP